MNQHEPKRSNATQNDQFFLTMSTTRQILTIALLDEEVLFTWACQRWVTLFKYLQEFKVAYQQRQLERLIFDYTLIIIGNWKPRFKIFELRCLWNQ